LLLGSVFLLCLTLAGCGFHPLYGDPRLEPQMASIFVEPIAEAVGFEMRDALINLLGADGKSGGKAYRLKISLTDTSQGVALQNDATITRYNDTLTATYVLTDAKGTEITRGVQNSLSSYNVANSPYSTLSAQTDADKRAVQDIADRIRIDLGVFFRHRDGQSGVVK
jgi:LPS-assembly lipoprotein